MTDLDDVLTLREAADIAGRSEEAMRKAAQRGSLPAKRVGGGMTRGVWITTRSILAEYLAWSKAKHAFGFGHGRDEQGRFTGPRRV